MKRRHPCEVTADRLLSHLEKYFDETDGELRDAVGLVRSWLFEIAEAHQ